MKRPVTFVVAAAVFATVAPNALADDGLVGTVTQATTPVTSTVTQATAPLTGTVTQATTPVTPIVETVTEAVAPVVETAAPVTQPVTDTVAPVLDTVTTTVAPAVEPVTAPLASVVEPVAKTVTPVTGAVTEALAPVTEQPRRSEVRDDESVAARRGAMPASTSAAPPPESRVSSTSIIAPVRRDVERLTPASSAGAPRSVPQTPAALDAVASAPAPRPTKPKPEGYVEPTPGSLFDKIPLPRGVWNASGPLSDGLILVFAILLGIWSLTVPPFARRLLRVAGSAWFAVLILVLVPPG